MDITWKKEKKYLKNVLDNDKNITISNDGKIVINDLEKLLKDVTLQEKITYGTKNTN